MRMRRGDGDTNTLGPGTGTNMKIIRLIYESVDEKSDHQGKMNDSLTKSDKSLVNPLVIGIAVVCGVLIIALIVVWTLYKRKGRREQPVETSVHSVSTPDGKGTVV
jgi:hypothetical protein